MRLNFIKRNILFVTAFILVFGTLAWGSTVTYWHDELIEENSLDYRVELIPCEDLEMGERKIVQKGEEGLKRKVFNITYKAGEKIDKVPVSEDIVKNPQPEIIRFGIPDGDFDPEKKYTVEKEMMVESTAYTHTGNRTFTGIYPYEGIVAVDPEVIPLGTKMYVEGYGFAEAQDTGGVIKGDIIDVFKDSREEALRWGRKDVVIYILNASK